MGSKSRYPYDPARTLARAYLTGLTGLRDLLRERVISNLEDVFDRTQDMWVEAQKKWEESKQKGDRDFSHITRVEKHMRANFLKMIWETTTRYGNREYKRVQNERKGKIGPMNRLLNMAGAQMRNYVVTRFPFPMPDIIESEGRKRVYGYTGDETFPTVHVTHATLPEMDFVDMIRSHVFELCRKCFIYNVPMRDARRYVNLLIYRLSPFLEYLYTSGESGGWGFKRKRKTRSEDELPDADKILRRIVREIRGLYATGNGSPRTVTDRLGEEYEFQGVSLFLDESIRLRESEDEETDSEKWGYYLRNLCDREILRDRDAQWLQAEAKNRARWYGIRLHRIMSMGLPQPYHSRSVILEGDKFAEIGEDFLIVAELPLKTNLGKGRADIIIFRRHLLERPGDRSEIVVWRPIAVFDIKSKTAFDWWIEGERRNSKRHGDVTIPGIKLKRRRLTGDEWDSVLARTPSRYEKRQSEVYAGSLLSEYADLTGDRTSPLPVTGTIVVDVSQDSGVLQKNLVQLLKSMFADYCGNLSPNVGEKLVVSLDDYQTQHLHLSLVIHKASYDQRKMLQEQGEPVIQKDTEFGLNKGSNLMLYCSVPSGSRSGPSGAWVSKYWHGLEYLYSMCESSGIQQVVWIDVSGSLRTKRLALTRLRLDEHRFQIRRFFKDIKFIDVSKQIQSFFFEGAKMPTLQSVFPEISGVQDSSMIVVSGWEMLEQMTPERGQLALREFKRLLVEDLRESECETLWFEKSRRGEETSRIYQKSKSLPFSKYSPFYGNVRKIVWNLPTQPYAIGQTSPMFDDFRIIAEQEHEEIQTCIVEIPALTNWSSKFWNKRGIEQYRDSVENHRGRQALEKEHVLNSVVLKQDMRGTALDLLEGITIPHREVPEEIPVLSIERLPMAGSRNLKILRTPILTFSPKITGPRHGLGYLSSSITTPAVTTPRRYRSQTSRNNVIVRTYRPPDESMLAFDRLDIDYIFRTEMERIDRFLRLSDNHEMPEQWIPLCKNLTKVLRKCGEIDSFRLLSDFLANHQVSEELWEKLNWTRKKTIHRGLSKESKFQLDCVLSDNPNLILDSGNYLFLSLLMVKYTHPTISDEILATLWLSLKSWQLLQLGFVSDENVSGRPTFDLESICNDLALRIACLQESPIPITPSVRYGRVIVVEAEEEGYDFWFLLQRQSKSADMIVGMWRNDNPIEQSNRFHWSVNRSDVLAASAKQAKSPIEYDDVAVITSGGKSYLWTRIGDIWNIVGSIEIIQKRSEELQLIRGVRVNPFGTETIRNNSFRSITDNELSKLVETNLERIQDIAASCIAVECTINLDSENYILDLHSSEAGEKVVYEQLVFERTQELVDFLREPLTTGAPVGVHSDKSLRYTWNPYLNIDYGELEILKPFVERKKPFSRTGFSLPQSAIDIVQDEPIQVHLTIKHDLNLCPIWHEINDDHAACWMLEGGDATPDAISSILSEGLTDIEIGEFLKTSDFHFQGNRYRVQIQFPEDNERIVFRESRVFARHLCEKKVPPSTFLRLSEETLECTIFQESNLIITTVKSDITGDTIYSGPLIKLSKDMDTQHALEYVEEVFEHIIDNRYSSEPDINRIRFYDELLVKVNEIITEHVSV